MSTDYYIVSDASREGFCLGTGQWYEDDATLALWSSDPRRALTDFLDRDGGPLHESDARWQERFVANIVSFYKSHPDWRIVSEHSMVSVLSDEKMRQLAERGRLFDDPDHPVYREVGSRYDR